MDAKWTLSRLEELTSTVLGALDALEDSELELAHQGQDAVMSLYRSAVSLYRAVYQLSKVEPAPPENLNEVSFNVPAGDQQSEEPPVATLRTLLHRQLFPLPDESLHPIPVGATHYALRRLVDGPAVDFWGEE